MKRIFTLLLTTILPIAAAVAQETEITTAKAKSMYKDVTKQRASVHDPSVVYEPSSKRYYVFGSHRGAAYSTNMQSWTQNTVHPWPNDYGFTWQVGTNTDAASAEAFVTPAVKKVTKGGVEVDFPQFNAMNWAARTDAAYDINGNMWAPDVIWNPVMRKWCMYLSINGDKWHSSIILLTSSSITGPYLYQGPIVISGFDSSSHSYKDTDYELAVGTTATLPSRYGTWVTTRVPGFPNNIDPAVFYDEEGKLWLAYGSWSGGIWMLELDENTGLRDYDVTYPVGTDTDPYFGKRIAGGYYVSGEGPYIEHIGNYYFLFMSYGGFAPDGGYEMRVFRSENPDGPYVDASGRSAIYTSYVLNYGTGSETRGAKIMGAYNKWGFMTVGECAQGHNSIIAAEDGRTYLIYHTKFNDGTIGHQVRTHQVFLNKNGWLVAAPFEYNGETTTDNDIATQQLVADSDIPGTYQVLFHKYKMDHANMEEVTPVELTLAADGTVSGARTGTWSLDEGTSYLTLTLAGLKYYGVLFEEQIDGKTIKTVSFSAMSNSGINVWGYKYRPEYALAWQINNLGTMPVKNYQSVSANVDLGSVASTDPNVVSAWSTDYPEIISEYGRFDPSTFTEDTKVQLSLRMSAVNYFWQSSYSVTAKQPNITQGDWQTGLLAHYGFDDANLTNTFNRDETASLKRKSTTVLPTTVGDELHLRTQNVVKLNFGANGKESYVEMANPLYGKDLSTTGATLSFWVRRLDDTNLYDALCGFYNTTTKARLYTTGNLYTGFNSKDLDGAWLDINHPETVVRKELGGTRWHHVSIVFSPLSTTGVRIYVDGANTSTNDKFNGKIDDKDVTTRSGFDYKKILTHIASCDKFYLGYGSFWGSAPACFDDVMVYDRALALYDAQALYKTVNYAFDFENYVTGIHSVPAATPQNARPNTVYDLSGRRLNGNPSKGIYIRGGKKYIVK